MDDVKEEGEKKQHNTNLLILGSFLKKSNKETDMLLLCSLNLVLRDTAQFWPKQLTRIFL